MEVYGIRANAVSKIVHVRSMRMVRKRKLISRDNQADVLKNIDPRGNSSWLYGLKIHFLRCLSTPIIIFNPPELPRGGVCGS